MDNKTINEIAAQIAQNYETAEVPMYGQRLCLPDRASVIAILELLQKLLFPAYFGDTQLLRLPPAQYSALLLQELAEKLTEQIARATGACTDDSAADAANQLLQQLPEIQQLLWKDLTANFDGDPAATSKQEVIFSYPGFYAIFVYRIAHVLYRMQIPMIPRMMTEYAHDHTGIVVGETTIIGDHVKMYQGATLGALSPRGGHDSVPGQRHPTVGDHVTIYAGATILGGETVIGANTVIGGNTFITESVKDATRVTIKAPELHFRNAKQEETT